MTFRITGLDETIRQLEEYKERIKRKQRTLLERLAAIGIETASVRFATARYDGTNDVVVPHVPEWQGDNKLIISASGSTVYFIEFGSGVHYSETHPKAAEFGAVRGSYGHGLGKLDSWRYEGEPGTDGVPSTKHPGQVVTHGNPPARAMFDAAEDIRDKILEIAKEVYAT